MHNRILFALGACAFLSLSFFACDKREIPFPKPYPDSVATKFLPGLVSIEGLDFNAAFSPNGQSFYFSRSQNGQWDIFISQFTNGSWSKPVPASFCDEKYSEADPAFSPDGKLFFISNQPRQGKLMRKDFDIWYIEPKEGGTWSEATNLSEVNSDSSEYYIYFAANRNLYFGSSRPGGYGSEDIYVSRFVNGAYTLPRNLGPTINSPASEHDPCVSDDERFIIFKSENRDDGFGQADLYFSKIDEEQNWTPAQNLGARINTDGYEYCPYFTSDGRFFFFSSQNDIMWMDRKVLEEIVNAKD